MGLTYQHRFHQNLPHQWISLASTVAFGYPLPPHLLGLDQVVCGSEWAFSSALGEQQLLLVAFSE